MRKWLLLLFLGCSATLWAQNGLVMPSVDPIEDSLSIARMTLVASSPSISGIRISIRIAS